MTDVRMGQFSTVRGGNRYCSNKSVALLTADTLVGESLVNSGSLLEAAGGTTTPSPTVMPEISSGEIVGMGAFASAFASACFAFSVSYDNNHAVLIRPGLTSGLNRPGCTDRIAFR